MMHTRGIGMSDKLNSWLSVYWRELDNYRHRRFNSHMHLWVWTHCGITAVLAPQLNFYNFSKRRTNNLAWQDGRKEPRTLTTRRFHWIMEQCFANFSFPPTQYVHTIAIKIYSWTNNVSSLVTLPSRLLLVFSRQGSLLLRFWFMWCVHSPLQHSILFFLWKLLPTLTNVKFLSVPYTRKSPKSWWWPRSIEGNTTGERLYYIVFRI